MKKPLALLLDKLIADAPKDAKGAVALQIQIDGNSYAGSTMHSKEHDGLYEMIVVDPQKRMAVSIFFGPNSISALFVPKEGSPIVQPKSGGRIITGAH